MRSPPLNFGKMLYLFSDDTLARMLFDANKIATDDNLSQDDPTESATKHDGKMVAFMTRNALRSRNLEWRLNEDGSFSVEPHGEA